MCACLVYVPRAILQHHQRNRRRFASRDKLCGSEQVSRAKMSGERTRTGPQIASSLVGRCGGYNMSDPAHTHSYNIRNGETDSVGNTWTPLWSCRARLSLHALVAHILMRTRTRSRTARRQHPRARRATLQRRDKRDVAAIGTHGVDSITRVCGTSWPTNCLLLISAFTGQRKLAAHLKSDHRAIIAPVRLRVGATATSHVKCAVSHSHSRTRTNLPAHEGALIVRNNDRSRTRFSRRAWM